jgi:hypothetical protein
LNIAVLVNKHFTIFFARIAPELERRGHKLFWISPSRRWSLWLRAEGKVFADRILTLPDYANQWLSLDDAGPEPLIDLEGPANLTISNLLLMCRALRQIPRQTAYAYLTVCRSHIEEFLFRNKIELCLGEATWGIEILIWLICQQFGIPCLHPTTTRIPDNRFAFFDALPHQIVEIRKVSFEDRSWAEDYYQKWIERPRRPVFSTTMPSPFAMRPHWWEEMKVSLFHPWQNKHDLTIWPMRQRLSARVVTAFNRVALRCNSPFNPESDRRFVLVCLHQQPEASIDVYGRLHSDQAHFVERLARLIPSTHEIWVKEHIDALGVRPPRWLRRIGTLPNVRLVDPRLSTFDLVRRAELVVSASGTVSYEAALIGTPAVTVASIFFSPLMSIDPTKYPDPVTWPWHKLLNERPSADETRERAIEFLAWVGAQSFEGMPFDPITLGYAGRRLDDLAIETAAFVEALELLSFPRRLNPTTGSRN